MCPGLCAVARLAAETQGDLQRGRVPDPPFALCARGQIRSISPEGLDRSCVPTLRIIPVARNALIRVSAPLAAAGPRQSTALPVAAPNKSVNASDAGHRDRGQSRVSSWQGKSLCEDPACHILCEGVTQVRGCLCSGPGFDTLFSLRRVPLAVTASTDEPGRFAGYQSALDHFNTDGSGSGH
jgi:hypothetical protein